MKPDQIKENAPVRKEKPVRDDESRGRYYKAWKESKEGGDGTPYCPRCKEKLDDESKQRKHVLCVLCRPGIIKAYPYLKNYLTTG